MHSTTARVRSERVRVPREVPARPACCGAYLFRPCLFYTKALRRPNRAGCESTGVRADNIAHTLAARALRMCAATKLANSNRKAGDESVTGVGIVDSHPAPKTIFSLPSSESRTARLFKSRLASSLLGVCLPLGTKRRAVFSSKTASMDPLAARSLSKAYAVLRASAESASRSKPSRACCLAA